MISNIDTSGITLESSGTKKSSNGLLWGLLIAGLAGLVAWRMGWLDSIFPKKKTEENKTE